jgi:hypothetical protein
MLFCLYLDREHWTFELPPPASDRLLPARDAGSDRKRRQIAKDGHVDTQESYRITKDSHW